MALQVSDPSVSVKFTCESDLAVQRRSAQPLDRAVWCFVGQVFSGTIRRNLGSQ